VAKTLFEAIGYTLGQKAAQAKNAFDLVGGTEEDSLRAEIRLGRDLAAALLERVPLVQENETTRFAAHIGRWLAGNVKEKKLPFIVRVTAEREPNALALPGGPVFVSWPLLAMCQWQRDEIAFVLGHEMARPGRPDSSPDKSPWVLNGHLSRHAPAYPSSCSAVKRRAEQI